MQVFTKIALVAALLQLPLLTVIFFGDFGFYFQGAMGSWNDFIAWVLIYAAVLLFGFLTACLARQFRLAAAQVSAPLLLAVGWHVYLFFPEPHYDAVNYQFLVGKTLEEVESTLGRRRLAGSGLDGYLGEITSTGEKVEYGTQHYNGMLLLYSADRRVIEVRDSQ